MMRYFETSLSYYEAGLKIEEEEKKEGSQDKGSFVPTPPAPVTPQNFCIYHCLTLSCVYHLTGIRCCIE